MTVKPTWIGRLSSPTGLTATAAVATALAVGGAYGAIQLAGQPTDATPAPAQTSQATPSLEGLATPSASPSVSALATPKASRSPQRASRASSRATIPRATATRSVTKKPSTSVVVGSGSCGASFYDEPQATANGETFDPTAMTAAHKTLAFNTRVRVTNPANGESVVVRINDRGPYIDGRCLDLSRAAFAAIASVDLGELTVKYEILG